jgi:hypothetical protein
MAQSIGKAGQLGLAALFQQQLAVKPLDSSTSGPDTQPI